MSDQGGISYSPARVNPFANVQVASYPEHVQVANYSQITYLNTQESEEEEDPVDKEYEPEYDVNEEEFEPSAPHRSPPAISSPTISSPPIALHKTKEKVKPPTPKERTPEKQPSKPLTSKQKKLARKREKDKAKKDAKNATKMTPNAEPSEPPPPPASEAIPAEPSPDEANRSEDMAPSPQPTDSGSSKPPEPSEPPEPLEQPNKHEAAEVTDKQVGEVEIISPTEPESIPPDGQSNEQEARELASETVPEAEVPEPPQLEKPDVAASTHLISTTESDTPADIQEPNTPALSTKESKLDISKQDANVASGTNGGLPDEDNDQETTATTYVGAISEPQTGEAADEPAAEQENSEPEKLKDVPEENSKEESDGPQDAAHESAPNSESDPAVAVEINEPLSELNANTKTIQESDEAEQPADTQKAETLEDVNETLLDGNPTDSTGETPEKSKVSQDPKTESNDENTTTEEEAPPPNNKDELSGKTIKQEAASESGPSEVTPEDPNASQIEETTPATTEPATEPQEQINNSEVTEIPDVKDDESQAVIDLQEVEIPKEIVNADSGDMPTALPPESENAIQADGPTEEHPSDPAAAESQGQVEPSEAIANIPDPVAVDVPEVPAIQSNDNAEKLPETGSEVADLKIPDEAAPEPTEDTSDVDNVESATGESVKPQEPETIPGSEVKEQPIIPEKMATDSLSAPDDISAEGEPASRESIPTKSVSEAPTPTESIAGEPASQELTSEGAVSEEPISQETATKEPLSEESDLQESTCQEAVLKELVPEDPVPQEPITPISDDPIPHEAAPEESTSQDTPQENISQEQVSKDPSPQEPTSEESVSQAAAPKETISEDLVSEEVTKESTQDSNSRELGSEQTVSPEPFSEGSASQEPISQEAVPEELTKNPAPQQLASDDIVSQGSDPQEPVAKESVSQENDTQDPVSQDYVPPKTASEEPAPQEPASDDQNPPQEPNPRSEIPVVSQDDVKSLLETSAEEVGQSTVLKANSPIDDSDEQLLDQPNTQSNANNDSNETLISELAPKSTDEPVQEPAQEIAPSEPHITDEDNSLDPLRTGSDDKNTTDAIGSLSEDEFVIVDKTDGEMDEVVNSPEQREQPNDEKPNDSSQLEPEGEHQIATPNDTASQDHQREDGGESPGEPQELLGNGDDNASNSAQPHDSSNSRAEADIVKPVELSLPGDTTISQAGKKHEQEVEKHELDQHASIVAEHIESHDDSAEAPEDEEKTPQNPTPTVINDQTAGTNTELSGSQVNSDRKSASIKEEEKPIDPSASSLEAIAEPKDPAPEDDSIEPTPDVGKEEVEGEASIEHDPDNGVTRSAPRDDATLDDQIAHKPEAPALKDVSSGQSESDLNETTPLVEAESCPIAPTEPELSQQVEDKQESSGQLSLETESPPQVLSEDSVEVPASSPETEKQLDQTSLPQNESVGEQIPQKFANISETNGEEEEKSGETHSPVQPAEPVSVNSETDNQGDLQSTLPSNPGQEEQLDSKSSQILGEAEQPDENQELEETGEKSTEEQQKAPEIPGPIEIPSVIPQDQTNLDQTEPDAPILAEAKESISQPPTMDSQGSETEDEEEAIDKVQEQEPTSSPLPTESLTDPLQPSIHENSKSRDMMPSESALVQETETGQDSDSHKDPSSRSSQIPSDHKPAAIEEPEPELTPSEDIQEPAIPEKANAEDQTVSDEQIVVEQTSVTPVEDQVPAGTQDSQEHVSVDLISTEEQATTEDQPKEELLTELPMPSQSQENEGKETADNNSQAILEEPAIKVADKVDKDLETSKPIQDQAPAESQVPVDQMPTEDQPVKDKPTEETPTEDHVLARGQSPFESQASIEDKEVIESDTPVTPSALEDHSGDTIPVAVDSPTGQLPDQPPECDLQEPQDHNVETTAPSDQAIVTEHTSDTSNELDEEPVVFEPSEGQTPDNPVSETIAEVNTEQPAGEETKEEILSTAIMPDKPQENESNGTDPEDKFIPEEPEVIHIQDNQNEEPDIPLPDSATGEQVSLQEAELSSESIVPSQPQENKCADSTSLSDKNVTGEPEAVHIEDTQSGEPDSNPSDPSIQDPIPSQEPNTADQISIKSDDKAKILPNTSSGDTTQSITTDSEPPINNSSKQLLTQDSEGYAPDKDVSGLEQPGITREEPSTPVTSPQFPENNDDKAINEAQAEPEQVQPTEGSEPAMADVIADIKEATIDEDLARSTDETLHLDTPSLKAAGNDSRAVAEDLAPPSDNKTDQSIEAIEQEAKSPPIAKLKKAENFSKQAHSEITVPDQAHRTQEDATGLRDKLIPEESRGDTIVPDQTQENEEATRDLGDKAILVEPVINNKSGPIKAPKENTGVIEDIKAEKIRSDDESKDTVGPIPTDGGPVRKASKGEDQLFLSSVGDTPSVEANDFDDTPESVPERLFLVKEVEVLGKEGQDIESLNRSLTQNHHPKTLSEQSKDVESIFVSPLEVQDATETQNRSLALRDNPNEETEAFSGAHLAEDTNVPSSADDTASLQVQEHEGGDSEIPEALKLNIRSDSEDLPCVTSDISDGDELPPSGNQERTSEEPQEVIPGKLIHDEPIEEFQDSSFVDISSVDLKSGPELAPQEPNKDGDHDIVAFSKELQPEITGAIGSEPLERSQSSANKESSPQQKSDFVLPDTPEESYITKASDAPLASTKVKRLANNLEAVRDHSNMVKLGIFRPTAFTFAGGAPARRHLVESDDGQAASSLPPNSAEVLVEKPAEPEPVAVSRDLASLEKSIGSIPSEGNEECSSPRRLSKPADPIDTPIPAKDEPGRETKSVQNHPGNQTTKSQQELARAITPESPEIVASTIPLSESFTVIERGQIPQNSSKRTLRPPLVHSSTQTEDGRDFGSQPSWSFINLVDLEPRSKTPGIILPDPTDSKARALGRAKSVRKQRRQTLKKAEEAVATAVILYAAAQELSPSSSSLLGSPQVENNTQKYAQEADGFFSPGIVAGNQSVGQNDYSSPVADLSTDDEEKKSADERHHRHRRHHHHHHHHPSRSKDVKGSGEHFHPRNTRIESNHSIKSSSDRSIPQTPKRDSGFSVESSRTTDSSNRRHRTPEEQAAHERRKEERRAAREAYDKAREERGKDSEAPPSDRHSSHRSSRRHSLSHSEKSHTERRSERFQPEKYSERSQPEKYPERSFSERYSERPQSERYSERSHSERHPAKDSASSSNKRFFDMRHGESSLASNYVPRTRSNSTNVPPPVFKEPSKSSGLLKRTNTGKSSKSHQESGEIPRPRSHRSHDHDHDHDQDQDNSSKRRRSEAKISGSLESTSSKPTPPSPTKDEHRQLRQKERQKAREATEAAEAKKKSGGIRAAFKKLFS